MRPHRISALLASCLAVTGCGPESTGSNRPPNPAADVSRNFETFTIADEDGLPPVLPNTVFFDFYRGLQPAGSEDDRNTASAVRQRLNELMGLTPSEDGKTYVAARNPMDFLNLVIDSNLVGNFNEGRQLMRQVINEGIPANYNTPENNAIIRFTEGENAGADQTWVYPLLDWRNNPQPGTVLTARQFVARTPADESEPQPEIRSMLWSARYQEANFSVSGYNQPDFELFSLTARTLGNVELRKEYAGQKTDIFFLNNPSTSSTTEDGQKCENVPPENPLGITIAGENPDCIRVELDYPASQVRVFTSRGEAPFTADCQAFNANYCGNQGRGEGLEAVIYNSVTVDYRQ